LRKGDIRPHTYPVDHFQRTADLLVSNGPSYVDSPVSIDVLVPSFVAHLVPILANDLCIDILRDQEWAE
jgi:hypothetical protein